MIGCHFSTWTVVWWIPYVSRSILFAYTSVSSGLASCAGWKWGEGLGGSFGRRLKIALNYSPGSWACSAEIADVTRPLPERKINLEIRPIAQHLFVCSSQHVRTQPWLNEWVRSVCVPVIILMTSTYPWPDVPTKHSCRPWDSRHVTSVSSVLQVCSAGPSPGLGSSNLGGILGNLLQIVKVHFLEPEAVKRYVNLVENCRIFSKLKLWEVIQVWKH